MANELFTQEIKEFISEHYTKLMKPEILEIIHSNFNCPEMTLNNLRNYYVRNNLKSGIDCRGRLAGWNKGKKMSLETYEKCKETMFKKGHISTRHKEVGSERINTDGYIEIKIAEPRKWELKHRVIYEQHHNVKLGKNDIVTFLDSNPLNCDIDNLVLISRATLRIINFYFSNFNNVSPEIKKTIILLASNIDATHSLKKKLKE